MISVISSIFILSLTGLASASVKASVKASVTASVTASVKASAAKAIKAYLPIRLVEPGKICLGFDCFLGSLDTFCIVYCYINAN